MPARVGRLILTVLALTMVSFGASAQEIKVRGGFVEENMKLGQNIHYWMSATYPSDLEIVLPDSNFNFSPFEYSAKKYYPSSIKANLISDSTIYTLQSYEIDKVQYLDLPAFVLSEGDTTVIRTQPDSILFFELTKAVSDTTKLKENVAYQEVPTQFNYPLMIIILVTLGVIALAVMLIFGKKFRRAWKLRQLKKEYIKFTSKLDTYINSLKTNPEFETAEQAVSDWKKFLEKLENKPYTKLTTREIIALNYTKELQETLKNIDRTVYGKVTNEDLYKEFQAVEDFTEHRYSVVIDEIKNG